MDADDSGRYPRGLVTLRTLLTGLSELDGRGKDLSLTARADLPFRSLARITPSRVRGPVEV